MKKFLNDPEKFEQEMLQGILYAHASDLKSVREDNKAIIRKKESSKNKVTLITGGGSGHLPLFLGYVGEGLLDGVAIGDIFQSPSPKQILDLIKAVEMGKGVLSIFGNYGGDIMNFEMANELAEIENIETATVIVTDDVASKPKGEEQGRRGVAGLFFVFKMAGAAAERGDSLNEVKRIAEKANSQVRSMGVGLSPCTIPAIGKPSFEIPEGEMELGIGIHGEPGIYRGEQKQVKDITTEILTTIIDDLQLNSGDTVAILVNGLGATPLEELYIVYKHCYELLEEKEITIKQNYIGEYSTSMEMVGFSISILELDEELAELITVSHQTPFLIQL